MQGGSLLRNSWTAAVAFSRDAGAGGLMSRGAGLMRREWPAALFYALLALTILALNLYAAPDPTALQRALASLLIVLCALPSMLWFAGRPSGRPLLPFLGMAYGAFFASPIFMLAEFRSFWQSWLEGPGFLEQIVYENALVTQALTLALLGWVCFLGGFFLLHQRFLAGKLPQYKFPRDDDHVLAARLGFAIGVIGLVFFVINIYAILEAFYSQGIARPLWVSFPVTFLSHLVTLAIAILFSLQLRGRLGRRGKVFLWGVLVVPCTWIGIVSGVVLAGLWPAVALILTYAGHRRATPWRALLFSAAIALVVALILLPTRVEFRYASWEAWSDAEEASAGIAAAKEKRKTDAEPPKVVEGGENLWVSVAENVVSAASSAASAVAALPKAGEEVITDTRLYIQTVANYLREGPGFLREGAVRDGWLAAASARMDMLMQFSHVIAMTPDAQPYERGRTYQNLFLFRMVRFAQGRDTPHVERRLAHQYGILPEWDLIRNVTFHQLIELFINFGAWGIAAGMFATGVLYAAISRLFCYADAGVIVSAAGIPVLTVLLLRSGNVASGSWGSVYVFCYLALFCAVLLLAAFLASRRKFPLGFRFR